MFLFHGYILSTAGKIQDFLPRLLPWSIEGLLHGIVWAYQ